MTLHLGSPDMRRAFGCRPPPNSPAHHFEEHSMLHSSLPSPHGHLRATISTASRTRHDSGLSLGSHCSTAQALEGNAGMLGCNHSTGVPVTSLDTRGRDPTTAHTLLQLAATRATPEVAHEQQQQEESDMQMLGMAAMRCSEPQTPPPSPTCHSQASNHMHQYAQQ